MQLLAMDLQTAHSRALPRLDVPPYRITRMHTRMHHITTGCCYIHTWY